MTFNIDNYKVVIDEAIERKDIEKLALLYKGEEAWHPCWKIIHNRIIYDENLNALVVMGMLLK